MECPAHVGKLYTSNSTTLAREKSFHSCKGIHPLLDEGTDVLARHIGDGLEETGGRHQHLAPHVRLVLLGRGSAGQAQQFVEDLQLHTHTHTHTSHNID